MNANLSFFELEERDWYWRSRSMEKLRFFYESEKFSIRANA